MINQIESSILQYPLNYKLKKYLNHKIVLTIHKLCNFLKHTKYLATKKKIIYTYYFYIVSNYLDLKMFYIQVKLDSIKKL